MLALFPLVAQSFNVATPAASPRAVTVAPRTTTVKAQALAAPPLVDHFLQPLHLGELNAVRAVLIEQSEEHRAKSANVLLLLQLGARSLLEPAQRAQQLLRQ